jgi:hypothetical protein
VSVGTTSFYIKRNNTEQGTVVFKNTSSYSDLSLVSQSIFPSYGSNIYYIPLPEPQLCFKMDTKIRIYDIKEGKEKDELIQHLKKGDLVKTITNWGEYHAIYEKFESK